MHSKSVPDDWSHVLLYRGREEEGENIVGQVECGRTVVMSHRAQLFREDAKKHVDKVYRCTYVRMPD